jgi:tetratricopeptide (TPR) repeat protein
VPLLASIDGADYRMGGTLSILDNVLKVQSRVVVLYYDLLAKPVALNVDHDVLRSPEWSAAALAGLAIHAAVVVAAAVAALRGRRLFPLCVAWFWLFLAPSVALPLNVVMNEHRLYLPGVAVALLAGAALARVGGLLAARWGTARGFAAASAPLLLLAGLAAQRSREWRSDEVLWTVAVARAPGSARAHLHLGAAVENRYRGLPAGSPIDLLDEAIRHYRAAERIHPTAYDVRINLGNSHLLRGERTRDPADFEEALAQFRAAGRIVGEHHYRPRYFQAVALTHLGRFDESLSIIRELRAGDDSKTRIYDDMEARTLRRMGDRRGAEACMLRVIALDEVDGRTDGLLTLGWWRFEDGDVAGARDLIQRSLPFAHRRREKLPFLYAARMLHLLGMRDEVGLLESAVRYGWSAPAEEVAWVRGGRTPGAAVGTRGAPAQLGSLRR